MANKKILHKRSSVTGKKPTEDQLDYGELAINFAEGSEEMFIKNSDNEVVGFITEGQIDKKIESKQDKLEYYTENTNAANISGAMAISLNDTLNAYVHLSSGNVAIGSVDYGEEILLETNLIGLYADGKDIHLDTTSTSGGSNGVAYYNESEIATATDLSTLKTELEAEISTATGGGITGVDVSGTSPLTLTGSVSGGTATIRGSVDLSDYAKSSDVPSVVDNLTSDSTTNALSANQGKVLEEEISAKQDELQHYSEESSDVTITANHVNINTDNLLYNGVEVATVEDVEKKQDKLTAGTGITIEDNVISSTATGSGDISSVTAEGTSPLSLSATTDNGAVTITGSVDSYSKAQVDEIRKDIEAEISTATGGGITSVDVSGTSPLTLSGSVSNGVATITGSVDLSAYAKESDLSNYATTSSLDDYLKTNVAANTYQEKLTAGTNITISGNTISATDTTYTAGNNITIDSSNKISADLSDYAKTSDLEDYVTEGQLKDDLTDYVTTEELNKAIEGITPEEGGTVSKVVAENADTTGILQFSGTPQIGDVTITAAIKEEGLKTYIENLGYVTNDALGNYLLTSVASSTYQEKLTAGTNVSISNNTISATDTTYSAGDNISISSSNVISADLSDYAKESDLSDYAKTSDLAGYATVSALDGKQDKLTAGTGITIENNVISSTADISSVTASGTSPLSLSATTNNGAVTITGSVDLDGYAKESDLANYATKSDLDNKQDKLTAGSNITISSNTISATDTTYTAGSNITIDENNVISVPDATSDVAGVVKPYSVLETKPSVNGATSEDGRYYQVQTDSENKLVVNVPWVKGESGQSGIDEVTASGESPLTLTATQSDSRVNISGSVDLSAYQEKLKYYSEDDEGAYIALTSGSSASNIILSTNGFNKPIRFSTVGSGSNINLETSYANINLVTGGGGSINLNAVGKAYYNGSEIATVTDLEGYATTEDLSSYVTGTTLSETLNDYITKSVASATYQDKLQYYSESTLSSQATATIDASRVFIGKEGDYRYFEGSGGKVTVVGGAGINMQTIGSGAYESVLDMGTGSIDIYTTHDDEKPSYMSLSGEQMNIGASTISLVTPKDESSDNIATYNGSEIATIADLKGYSALSDANVGDVLFYDSVNNTKFTVPIDDVNTDDYPSTQYTPIGVVAIPSSHNVYGTKEAGVMSLAWMSYEFPETGVNVNSTDTYTHLTMNPVNLGDDNPKNVCATNGSFTYASGNLSVNNVGNVITGTLDTGVYLPTNYSAISSGPASPTDGNSEYAGLGSGTRNTAISPYFTDGSRNNVYWQVFPNSSKNNALSDFDGKNNTIEALCHTTNGDWQSSASITESDNQVAFECCWRFHTEGTNPGDWYLPSLGEMGYVVVRFATIYESIKTLSDLYGSSGSNGYIGFDEGDILWSSTMFEARAAWTVDLTTSNFGKIAAETSTTHPIRAFTRF